MTAHAKLGPSAAERWVSCPASVRVAARFPNTESSFAQEGTAAHELGELKARHRILGTVSKPEFEKAYVAWLQRWGITGDQLIEMAAYTNEYVELLERQLADHPGAVLLLEQRVQTGIPGCWGTADAIIVSTDYVGVTDLKYGAGVAVSAVNNYQLQLYGVGALETYGDPLGEAETVEMTIFQPRAGGTSTFILPAAELRAWRDEVPAPAAELSKLEDAPFGPSEKACRWCPAAGSCRARMEKVTQEDFGRDPDLLEPDELAELLTRLPEIKSWCSAVGDTALDQAYSGGVHLPGWKVVMSRGNRFIQDDEAALQQLDASGYAPDTVSSRKLLTLGALEKLVGGKVALEGILGDALGRRTGRPSLVGEDDPRPATKPEDEAAAVFSANPEEE